MRFWERRSAATCAVIVGLALCFHPIRASAQTPLQVPAGCVVPTSTSTHTNYYVDPVHGSMSGNGSQAQPWHTLAEVFDVRNHLIANAPAVYMAGVGIIKPNPDAPIKSGDTIYLLSGNHGSPFLQGNFGTNQLLYGYNNTSFITVTAAPGQTPIITQLTLKGVGKWLFQGLTFQSLQNIPSNGGQPFTSSHGSDYDLVGMSGPNNNVIFNQDLFQSQADVSAWSPNDFLGKRVSGLTAISGSCYTLTNNKIQNIGFGIGIQRATNVLVRHNLIDTFTDDGIDYGSNSMVIDGNLIINSINDGDGFHQDGMQGQPDGNTPVTNVIITNNMVINQTKAIVSPANLQGIDAFDGVWQNVFVENNIVITNAYHGITFYGANHLAIVNNTVLGTSTGVAGGSSTWIDVSPSKSGQPSTGVTVRNNIAALYPITAASAWIDHNLVATMNTNYIKYFKASASVIGALPITSVIAGFNPTTFTYDPRLLSSKAVGTGGFAIAPKTDIRGILRGSQMDLGAVKFGGSPVVSLQ